MTGRELVLVILGAGLAGGASGVAVNLAMTPKEPLVAQVPPEVAERLKSAEASLEKARAHKCRIATLEVRRSNDAAIALYGSLGFRAVGMRPAYYTDNREDAVVMIKDF